MSVLTGEELSDALAGLDGWEREPAADNAGTGAIVKDFRCASFPAAVAFVVRIGFAAESADHHPDIEVRYDRVRCTLSTHSQGGVTAQDIEMAAQIDTLAAPG